ncbi:hypothetical protein M3Y98_00705000 [Aphelenchoides besseyi]|nr:hypothetical protein M3Y98_00705000 [Aphelenchoides besseyi]
MSQSTILFVFLAECSLSVLGSGKRTHLSFRPFLQDSSITTLGIRIIWIITTTSLMATTENGNRSTETVAARITPMLMITPTKSDMPKETLRIGLGWTTEVTRFPIESVKN